jgi:hypothetical protein
MSAGWDLCCKAFGRGQFLLLDSSASPDNLGPDSHAIVELAAFACDTRDYDFATESDPLSEKPIGNSEEDKTTALHSAVLLCPPIPPRQAFPSPESAD